MSDRISCRCPRCTIRGLMGPAVLITLGVLFLLNQLHNEAFDFSNTWPFILIVIGAVMLASSMAPMNGHIEPPASPATVPPPPVPPATGGAASSPPTGQGR
jgi:Domain of unknown function (DUF5668)